MTKFRYDEANLELKIDRLSRAMRPAFAAACAERMLPCYGRFSVMRGRGGQEILSGILLRLWRDLSGETMCDEDVEKHIEVCLELIPEEQDGDWTIEQAMAEDAAAALVYALRCRLGGLSQDAVWAARRAY